MSVAFIFCDGCPFEDLVFREGKDWTPNTSYKGELKKENNLPATSLVVNGVNSLAMTVILKGWEGRVDKV